MKNIRTFIAGFVFAAFLLWGVPAMAGVAGFRTDLIAAFTANFTAPQRQTIANSFVSAYQSEWSRRVAEGTVDNTANRGQFAVDKIVGYVQEVVHAEEYKTSVRAVPTPTPLPQ